MVREDEEHYRAVVEDQTEIISRFLGDGTLTFVNEAFCRFFGKTRKQLIGCRWQPRAAAEDVPLVEEKLRSLSPTTPVVTIENPVHAASGDMRWMQFVNRAFYDPEGRLLETQSVGRDITERKQAEENLRASEERFRVALTAAPIVVFNQDRDLRYTWIGNPALGWKAEEILGRTDAELLGAKAASPLTEIKRRVLETGRGERKELLVTSAGQCGWFDLTVEPTHDAAGRIVGITCAAMDITERKRAEAALRQSEAVRRQALESAPDAIFAIDREYRLLFNNQRHQEALVSSGSHPFQAGESVLSPAYPPEVRTYWRRAYDRAFCGHKFKLESEWTTAEGRLRVFENTFTPFLDANGGIIGALVFARNITERKQAELERAKTLARLAVVEEQERQHFARELHDQTAQRLVALSVELKTLEANLAAGRSQAARLRSLRDAVDYLQLEVRQIAWDLRTGEVVKGGLGNALREYLEEWSERAQVPMECEFRGLAGKPLSAGIEATLYRVAQEALTNVQRHAQAHRVSVLLERDASLVRLTVEDDGRGFDAGAIQMSPEATAPLGLLGMKERVGLVGGTLLIESSPGAGTTILVRIPIPAEVKP